MGSPSLLQGIFPTQESNPGLPHCKRILNQLSHKGSHKGPFELHKGKGKGIKEENQSQVQNSAFAIPESSDFIAKTKEIYGGVAGGVTR